MTKQSTSDLVTSLAATLLTIVLCAAGTMWLLPNHPAPTKIKNLAAKDNRSVETTQDWDSKSTNSKPEQTAAAQQTAPLVPASAQDQAVVTPKVELSEQDWQVIQDLPPACTHDLKTLQQQVTRQASQAANPQRAQPAFAQLNASQPQQVRQAAFQQATTEAPSQQPPVQQVNLLVDQLLEQAPLAPEKPNNDFVNRSYHEYALAMAKATSHSPHSISNPHSSTSTFRSERATALVRGNSPDDLSSGDDDPHLEVYSRNAFPSAKECAQCHKQIYEEWASSSHAYASVSPMFHVFEETINRLSQGTIGYFCYRCHSPVSTTMGLRRDQPIWDGPPVFREGVTCVACHRVKTPYGKVDGERRIEPGDIYEPVYGGGDGRGVTIADKYRQYFKVKTERSVKKTPGQAMHRRSVQFEQLTKSSFCVSCHQVAVEPGIKLEVVWDQYRASPAYRDGITCQDCHMGRVPGLNEGYSVGPGAVVNDRVINAEKKHSNHIFYGPGYSIAHPGVFPHHLDADRWTMPQWLEFDWRAGWGTDEFEDALADGKFTYHFPSIWAEADDRYDAREIVDENLKKLRYKHDLRRQLLENGSKLDGPFFNAAAGVGQPLKFRYCLTNLNSGHNMPSGSLGAQPQLWMNVVLIDPAGNRVWESGYLDSNGDLADNHSLDVLARKIPLDTQLVNLQTKFLTTNVKGTDREMYLPVNFDFDQLPFLRPPQQPVSVINHPPFIRMEGHSIPPLGKRNAKFSVPARLIQMPGTYRLSVRMRSRAEPIYFMRFCNATPEMQRMMNEWICDFHVSTVSFEIR